MRPDEGTGVEFGFDEEDLYRFDFDTAESIETETGATGVSYEQYVRPER